MNNNKEKKMTTAELRATIAATGFKDVEKMSDNMVQELGKALGLAASRDARAEVVDYTTTSGKAGKYVKTPPVEYRITAADGKVTKGSSRGSFVPLEAVAQTIEDLKAGLELAKSQGLIK
jgi:hypothetical protein